MTDLALYRLLALMGWIMALIWFVGYLLMSHLLREALKGWQETVEDWGEQISRFWQG